MGILKDQMISYMQLHGYSQKTIKSYVGCVQTFSNYYLKSPLRISSEEVTNFFLHLRRSNKADATIHMYYESLKFFFRMHKTPHILPKMKFPRLKNHLPLLLDKKDIQVLLQKCNSLKYKTLFTLIYSAGLRISEAINLKLSDIDYSRKTIFIKNGKNKKDRYTILADDAAEILRKYISVYHPINYLFYAKDIEQHISTDCVQKFFKQHVLECKLNPSAHVHTLRHCFATHLLEKGTSIFHIMHLLGHTNINTTMVYLHMQAPGNLNIKSPLCDIEINGCNTSNLFLESA